MSNSSTMIPFWTNNPSILFDKKHIMELWPMNEMAYEQKLNAITRIVLVISLLGFLVTSSLKILGSGIIAIFMIFLLYKFRKQRIVNALTEKEGFKGQNEGEGQQTPVTISDPETLTHFLKEDFKEGNKKNPFSNVLMTEYLDDPLRRSAPPSFNPDVEEGITKNVKRSVQMMNPGIKNTNKQLFSSLTDQFDLDQSNRVFFSNPNTRIPNDQGAYAKFLYGDMPSAKEDTDEGKMQALKDNYRYILY